MRTPQYSSAARSGILIAAIVAFLAVWLARSAAAAGPDAPSTVTAQVSVVQQTGGGKEISAAEGPADAVVWLVPLDANSAPQPPSAAPVAQLVQKNKMFEPHVLVIQAGSLIAFPNKDPFFHNVFSLFDGKRFDLGLYEAGTSKTVKFDRVGISFIFCNIHENMAAVVVAVPTPYFGKTDSRGRVEIPGVPDGRYEMHVWYEHSSADDLKHLDRTVTIGDSTRTLDVIRIPYSSQLNLVHKNKYGEDYIPAPSGAGSSYSK